MTIINGNKTDLWLFYGFLCKRFSLIKVYQGWALAAKRPDW